MKKATRRIEELEAELGSRGASFHIGGELSEELRESFLRHVLEFDDELPASTMREQLKARGKEIPTELWPLLELFADLNIVIAHTDHLDDAALLAFLVGYLDESFHLPNDPASFVHVDTIGSGSEEDNTIFLRYYATDEDREFWRSDFPDEPIPPKELPPFDRDRLLAAQWS
ncbi:MAG: hypothetical protein ACJ74H_18410 [Thermoanaerobaculia bacterium]